MASVRATRWPLRWEVPRLTRSRRDRRRPPLRRSRPFPDCALVATSDLLWRAMPVLGRIGTLRVGDRLHREGKLQMHPGRGAGLRLRIIPAFEADLGVEID